jgi:hypothetical protein
VKVSDTPSVYGVDVEKSFRGWELACEWTSVLAGLPGFAVLWMVTYTGLW